MKIIEVKTLAIEAVKVIRFGRFPDHRGYFTEHYRKSDFQNHPEVSFFKGFDFLQANESYSRAGTVRGLHFQWNPYMGKLVRTLFGRMIDMVLDIRKGSPTFGKIILYDMPVDRSEDFHEWIWVPPGFAHGNFFSEDTLIEYLCTGRYNPECEAGIYPLSKDIDWQLCEPKLRELFDGIVPQTELISDKDRKGFSVTEWQSAPESENFMYEKAQNITDG